MRWIYRGAPISREKILSVIECGDLRAGWELRTESMSDWQWGRLHYNRDGSVNYCETVRECSEKEKIALNDLLKGEICCRILRVSTHHLPWALASIE